MILLVRKYWLEFLMITPLFLYILGFTLAPVFYSFYLSLTERFTGAFPTLDNYRYIIGHGQFKEALLNTIFLTLISLTLEMTVGMTIALMLSQKFLGKGAFRSILLVPMGVPTLVSAVVMTYIFSTSGYFNSFLFKLGFLQVPFDWAAGGLRTIITIAFADMWKVTPLVVLLLLAGLETIPPEVYEAAHVDGASSWQTFWQVTLPLMKPTITMVLILRAIDAFRIFEIALVLAGRATPVLATYAYTEYFNYNNPHTSGAASTILLFVIIAFILSYLKIVERR